MQLIRGQHNLTHQFDRCVVTIGNFDGLHRGHQTLIEVLIQQAKQSGLPSVLITFEPHPQEFFAKNPAVPRLMRLTEKWVQLSRTGLDYLFCLRFNRELAEWSAKEFVEKLLLKRMGMRGIIVGDDFRFGARRSGDFVLLKELGRQHGFFAQQVSALTFQDHRISSTRVREALQQADFAQVQQLLGRSYSLIGKVAHGEKLGRKLGFPTANIQLHRRLVALAGIYVVRIHGLKSFPLKGVANIGTRPTVNDHGRRVLLEVYIFDFDEQIYGRNIEVEFLHKLRDEERFATLELMAHQIQQDVLDAKNFFKKGDY